MPVRFLLLPPLEMVEKRNAGLLELMQYAGAHAAGTIGASAFIFLVVVAVQATLIKSLELGSAKPEMSGDRPANYPTLPTRIPRPTKAAVKPQHTACRRARLSRSGLSAGCTIGECARRSRSWRDSQRPICRFPPPCWRSCASHRCASP